MNAPTLQYNGALTEDTMRNIRDMFQKYPHVLEISKLPDNFHVWCQANMKTHDVGGEGCMANPIISKTHLWALVGKNRIPFDNSENGLFIFFSSRIERDLFLNDFEHYVIKAEPFTSRF